MNIFGIGFAEFILIFIIALMIFGPHRLPVYAGRIGRKLREWRMMSQVFLIEWREELAALEEARQSLEEAKQALLEAQDTVSVEVKGVRDTVATEMSGAQRDVSAELARAQAAVNTETAQVRGTMSEVRQGEQVVATDPGQDIGETATVDVAEAEDVAAEPGTESTSDIEADITAATETTARVEERVASEEEPGVDESDVLDVAEVDEIELSGVDAPQTPQPLRSEPIATVTELDEVDVSEVKTISDVASEVATEIAERVASEVAEKVARNVASEVAEEVARLVAAKISQTGGGVTSETQMNEVAADAAPSDENLSPLSVQESASPAVVSQEVVSE